MTDARVLSVSCAKGGVGKTTTAINLAAATAGRSRRSVLLVEADLAMGDVQDFLDLDFDPGADPTLDQVLAGTVDRESAIYDYSSTFSVLPSGVDVDDFRDADQGNLPGVIERAHGAYDLVLIDTPAGLNRGSLLPMGLADGVLLVSTPRASAVRDTQKTAQLAERVDGHVLGLVLTQVGGGSAPDPERIADFLGVAHLGSVPLDEAVPRAQDAGRPVIADAIDSPAARAYWELAGELTLLEGRPMPTIRGGEGGEDEGDPGT